jgi:hypothetical protein
MVVVARAMAKVVARAAARAAAVRVEVASVAAMAVAAMVVVAKAVARRHTPACWCVSRPQIEGAQSLRLHCPVLEHTKDKTHSLAVSTVAA